MNKKIEIVNASNVHYFELKSYDLLLHIYLSLQMLSTKLQQDEIFAEPKLNSLNLSRAKIPYRISNLSFNFFPPGMKEIDPNYAYDIVFQFDHDPSNESSAVCKL